MPTARGVVLRHVSTQWFAVAGASRLQGQTITAQGPYNFRLEPGTYEITGEMRTYVLSVDFSRVAGTGGVQAGSVRSLSGPAIDVSQCGVLYLTYSPPSSVRVQFTVTESEGAAGKS